VASGLACIHGVFGGDLGDTDPDLLTNAVDGLALPGSLSEVVVYLQISRDADDRCRASPILSS
jgi:hypothetical protein